MGAVIYAFLIIAVLLFVTGFFFMILFSADGMLRLINELYDAMIRKIRREG